MVYGNYGTGFPEQMMNSEIYTHKKQSDRFVKVLDKFGLFQKALDRFRNLGYI